MTPVCGGQPNVRAKHRRNRSERAVDALFTVLHANGATSFSEVMSNFPASIPAMLGVQIGRAHV